MQGNGGYICLANIPTVKNIEIYVFLLCSLFLISYFVCLVFICWGSETILDREWKLNFVLTRQYQQSSRESSPVIVIIIIIIVVIIIDWAIKIIQSRIFYKATSTSTSHKYDVSFLEMTSFIRNCRETFPFLLSNSPQILYELPWTVETMDRNAQHSFFFFL